MGAPVGVGIVGVGRMGSTHARIIARLVPEARVVALADVDTAATRRLAEELGVRASYASAAELAADPAVQGVFIAVSSSRHLEVVRQVAAAGRDMLCEKPLALTMADTDDAIAAAAAAGVRLQVGLMRRWDPGYRRAQEKLRSGRCGSPVLFRSVQVDAEAPPPAYADPAVSGGIMVDMGIHDFDLARWLMADEVIEVHAYGSSAAHPALAAVGDVDSAVIALRFADGGTGAVQLARSGVERDDVRTEVVGTVASVHIDGLPEGAAGPPIFETAYAEQARGFARAIASDSPVEVGSSEARAALAIALAADRSRREGRPVAVDS